jgi:hypothetical protein
MVKTARPTELKREGNRLQNRELPRFGKRRLPQPSTMSVFGFTHMTRGQALQQVVRYLRQSPQHVSALRLIHLFHLHGDELAEAGVPFELLRLLDRQGRLA